MQDQGIHQSPQGDGVARIHPPIEITISRESKGRAQTSEQAGRGMGCGWSGVVTDCAYIVIPVDILNFKWYVYTQSGGSECYGT